MLAALADPDSELTATPSDSLGGAALALDAVAAGRTRGSATTWRMIGT